MGWAIKDLDADVVRGQIYLGSDDTWRCSAAEVTPFNSLREAHAAKKAWEIELENRLAVVQLCVKPAKEKTVLFSKELDSALSEIKSLLLSKNAAYGDSALNPVRIFSKADPEDQLLVRIDDKLSRIARGSDAGEDVLDDLLGYLVMLKIQRKRQVGKK